VIDVVWQLGGLPQYEALNLRKGAHMLGEAGGAIVVCPCSDRTVKGVRPGAT
jgi:hypothetical protein